MPILVSESDSNLWYARNIPISPNAARTLRFDSIGYDQNESFSVALAILIREPSSDSDFRRVVFELGTANDLCFSILLENSNQNLWRFILQSSAQTPLLIGQTHTFAPSASPFNKYAYLSLSFERNPNQASLSTLRLASCFPDSLNANATLTSSTPIGSTPFPGLPNNFSIGAHHTTIASQNAHMRGLFILWAMRATQMSNQLIVNGQPTVQGTPTVNLRDVFLAPQDLSRIDLAGPPSRYPQAIFLAVNHSCSGRLWNGFADLRPGITTPSVSLFDKGAASFNTYWNRASGGGSFLGNINHVNPYQAAGIVSLPPPVNKDLAPGVTAPFTNDGPIGTPGPKARAFAAAALGTTPLENQQIRVLFAANSRGVTAGAPADLILDSGTRIPRQLFSTYSEAGIASFTPLWEGALVGHSNLPIPTGLYSYQAAVPEGDVDSPEPLFGPDCSLHRPRCTDLNANRVVAVRIATDKLIDTTYSRTWIGSRYATAVAGAAARFQGNSSPRQLKVGYAYRLLCRPELGMPTSEGLEFGFYVLRNPLASTFTYSKCHAPDQGAPNSGIFSSSLVTSDLDQGNVARARVMAYSPPQFINDREQSALGYFVIDNRAGLIGNTHLGQWIELSTISNARKDISAIASIDNSIPAECRIYFEGALKNDVLVNFDHVHWLLTPKSRYRKISMYFNPSETSQFRGVQLNIPTWTPGIGLTMLGCHFRNATRPGIIAGQAARSGCGYAYQLARFFNSNTGRKAPAKFFGSPFEEMVTLLAPDVLVCCTADQGDSISFADESRYTMRNYIRAWRKAIPKLESLFYSTGPEFTNEQAFDYREDAKASFHVIYRQAAQDLDIPHTSLYYDLQQGTGALNAHLTGEITESRTHPSTSYDVQRIARQIASL